MGAFIIPCPPGEVTDLFIWPWRNFTKVLMKEVKKFILICLGSLLIFSGIVPEKAWGITIQEEEELSRQFLKVVLSRYELIQDPVVVSYVRKVGRQILSNLPPQPFKYHFYVVKEDVYNAFATPAGHIYINSGLFAAMENEEELAGILAHEISHVVARHISQKIERAKKVQLATLAGLAAGAFLGIGGAATAANALTMGSMAAGQSIMLSYSREDEMQADQMGMKFLNMSGYSGKGLITMLGKIRSKQWFGSKQIPTYLTTHPASEDRVVFIDSWLAQHPRAEKKGDIYAFRRAHTFLVATYEDADTSFRIFEQAVSNKPDDAMAHYGYGLALSRAGNREKAVVHLKAALESNAFDPYILKDLGKIYFLDGKYEQALNILENVIGLSPVDPEGLYYLGRTEMELGKLDEAVASLTKLIEKNPRFTPAFYSLGEAYGKQNKLADAHYYLGIYYKKTGKLENAIFHLTRALKDMTDPEKKRQIEKMLKQIRKVKRKAG